MAATAILLLTMVAAGAGLAHGRNTITALNELSFAPNKALKVAFRSSRAPSASVGGSGSPSRRAPLPEAAGVEAHTLSVVARSDVPETIDEVLACEACGPVLAAHDPDDNGEPPFEPVVNVAGPD